MKLTLTCTDDQHPESGRSGAVQRRRDNIANAVETVSYSTQRRLECSLKEAKHVVDSQKRILTEIATRPETKPFTNRYVLLTSPNRHA